MPATLILGTQWGDEGKGKITDLISHGFDAVVRYQGGNNAGHTIVRSGKVYKLHIIPSGILTEGIYSVIGDGCVVDPWVLTEEIRGLHEQGISTERLVISDRAHLIMPYHRYLDGMQESSRSAGSKVGTTGRGIGPCYEDKARRNGIRVGDLAFTDILTSRVRNGVDHALRADGLKEVPEGLDPSRIVEELKKTYESLKGYIRDVPAMLNDLLSNGKNVLIEGAQGVFLDMDKGTYPFVTSSSVSAGNASSGTGIGPARINSIIGIVKAYTTRVGEGPFPTEVRGDLGEEIQKKGHEFGTTTERPRRCGWLDLVMVRSAVRWNSIDTLALTKLDVLSGMEKVKVCTAYRLDEDTAEDLGIGTRVHHFPSHYRTLEEVEPVYVEMEGPGSLRKEDWEMIGKDDTLPGPIAGYVALIEKETCARVGIISYGPDRSETLFLGGGPWGGG